MKLLILTLEKPGIVFKIYLEFENGESTFIKSDSSCLCTNKKFQNWKKNSFDDSNWKEAVVTAVIGDKPWNIPSLQLKLPPALYLRKEFLLKPNIKSAFVCISALGLYELHVNGEKISDYLAPGWTDYNTRVYYNLFDVKENLISSDKNSIGIIIADGWYSGYLGWENGREYYGDSPKVIAQLFIQYEDGTAEIIRTDNSWKSSHGPILEADLLKGEKYDARVESKITGWNKANFDEKKWLPVNVFSEIKSKLQVHPGLPIKIKEELAAIKITEPKKGIYVFDLGQNLAGVVKLKVRANRGRKITIRYAEMLNEDGTIYIENLRMSRSTDVYVCKGQEEEIWQPKFTYHGFRYVEVKGLSTPSLDCVIGLAIGTAMPPAGSFNSSNKMLNKIYKNILWSQKSNYIDIPTDCPQRDERLGWTGDAVTFISTAALNMDVAAFYTKWLVDLNDAQREDGAYPPIAPFINFGAGPLFFGAAAWADAGIVVPYFLYKTYGDKNVLNKYYNNMKSYIDYLIKNSVNFIRPEEGYGDWLNLNDETSKSFIGTAFFAYVVSLMIEVSAILEKVNDVILFNNLWQNIKTAFSSNFFDEEKELTESSQTTYTLVLAFNLLDEKEQEFILQKLVEKIESSEYHLSTGFIGLGFIFKILKKYEKYDLIMKIILNDSYPSWGNMINNGATTLWERWDSFDPQKGFFDPTMNSFNHCSLGTVGECFYSVLGGINLENLDQKEVIIKPFFAEQLDFADVSYNSIYGKICVNWKKKNGRIFIKIEIPFNIKAEFHLMEFVKSKQRKFILKPGVNQFEFTL